MELYRWQKDCLRRWEENGHRGIVNVITGAGKTVLAMAAMEKLCTKLDGRLHVYIVVPKIPLLRQWRRELHGFFPADWFRDEGIGQFCGTRKDKPGRRVMIYVVNSARYSISRHILHDMRQDIPVLLVGDECHHYTGEYNARIFDFLQQSSFRNDLYYSLGLSATPDNFRYETVLVPALGAEIYRYGFSQALKDKRVSPFTILQVALSFSAQELNEYTDLSYKMQGILKSLLKQHPELSASDSKAFIHRVQALSDAEKDPESPSSLFLLYSWRRSEITATAFSRILCAEQLIHLLAPSERILVFCERIAQANALYERLLPKYPGKVGRYHSEIPASQRQQTFEAFHSGQFRILISCKALDEGIDVPDATVGIVLSGEQVNRQRIQRLGRILRTSPGKHSASLYYLYIRESSEDPAYLADLEEMPRLVNLNYDFLSGTFSCPACEDATAGLLEETGDRLDKAQLEELLSCVDEGLIRADWILDLSFIEEKITLASTRHEKNYWIVMKRLHLRSVQFSCFPV